MNYRDVNKVVYRDKKIVQFLIESKTYGDKVVTVDVDDYFKIKKYHWYIQQHRNTFYVRSHTYTRKKCIKRLHRVILGVTDPEIKVDHKDGNGLNNVRYNLRVCTTAENTRNKQKSKGNTSGFKGVCWHKRDKCWAVQICVDYKGVHLGHFPGTPEGKIEAAKAYNVAAIKYYGEFARLNNI